MSELRQSAAPFWLDKSQPELFPDPNLSMEEPDGLLAVGGDLSEQRLLAAYRQGIFPWYSKGQPVLWWSPNPRMVLYPENLHISRSLAKTLRQQRFTITFNQCFAEVIDQCAAPRDYTQDTWITSEMREAYVQLHDSGYAHSVECWQGEKLVGGLYGIAVGKVFFGESMFSRQANASKAAFVSLVKQLQHWGYMLIDCQVYSDHLASLGATTVPRKQFLNQLTLFCPQQVEHPWSLSLTSKEILA